MIPALLDLIPPTDVLPRHERCAVVSGGGALAGSKLGPTIDASSAVFRTDNSPSAMKFSTDVGKRTNFQVLNRDWGETLLKRSDATGSPHVARWWLDVATVVLWHPASLRTFAALRTLYPDAVVGEARAYHVKLSFTFSYISRESAKLPVPLITACE